MDLREYIQHSVEEFKEEVVSKMETIGQEAVEIAKQSTAYQDVTGNLRSSTAAKADEYGLHIKNSASYASEVEARCGNVIAEAVLYAHKRLNE